MVGRWAGLLVGLLMAPALAWAQGEMPIRIKDGVQAGEADVTSGGLHINLRNAAGTEIGTAGNPVRVDPTGSTAQPVSGTVTSNAGTGTFMVGDGSGPLTVDGTVTANAGTGNFTVVQGTGTNLHTVVDSGAVTVSQGTAANLKAQVQGEAASGAAKAGNPVQTGGVFNTTQPTVTTGQAVEHQSTARGALIVAPGVDGFALTANQSVNVTQFGGSAVATGTGAGGAGIPRVTISNDSSLAANQSVNLNQVAGSATATGNGTAAGSIRVSVASDSTGQIAVASLPNEGTQTAANSISVTIASDIASGATGQPLNAAQGLVVRQPVSCTNRIAISQTADTQVVTGTAGQRIYICAIMLIASAAETVNIIEGTGSVCATSPTALYGSTTEASGMAFPANGGFSQTSGQPFVHTAVDGNNLCITQVGTARIAGSISFIVAAD